MHALVTVSNLMHGLKKQVFNVFYSSIVVQFRASSEEQSVQQLVSMLRVSGGHPSSGVTVENEVAPEGWRAGGCVC